MSTELRREWNKRAERPGLPSVMSTRWSETDSAAATTDLKKKVFRVLGNIYGKRLLEVGSGIGRFTQDFRDAGADVYALDHSINMIHRARQTVSPDVHFINASVSELPLRTDNFDTSVAITVLQHITDPTEFQNALNELKRVTRDRIIICDELRQDEPEKVTPFTMLRTVDQFTDGMSGWHLASKDIFNCLTDEYTLMVWEKDKQ